MIFYVLILSLAAVILNLTLPLMAGLYIVSDLGGNSYLSPYGVSFFCIGNALAVPLGRPWVTRVSAVHLYVICLCFMCFFSWECAVATNYFQFIVFRFFEGVASGPLYLLITTTLIPLLAKDRKPEFVLPIVLTTFAITPILGACWGGFIAYYSHWRFLFFTNIPICLFLLIYVGYRYRKLHTPRQYLLFDTAGYFFYGLALVFLGTALIIGQQLDWFRSYLIDFLISLGSLSAFFFYWQSRRSSNPIIDFGLFKNPYFCFAILNVGLLFAIYFGIVILLSLWLKLYVNYTPYWIILIIGAQATGAWIPLYLNHKRFDPRYPLALALFFFALSCFYTANFNVEINFGRIAFSRVLAALALALFLPPLFKLSVQLFPREKFPEGASIFHVVRLIGSGLGATLFVTLWQHRQVFYHQRLGANLTTFSQETLNFFERARQYHWSEPRVLALLDAYLDRQATALALDDCFYLMGWMVVVSFAILMGTFLFRPAIHFDQAKEETELSPA